MLDWEKSPYGPSCWLYDWVVQALELNDEPMYVSLFKAINAKSVLELGCGTGRIGEALARAGFSYTGVDLSPYMLERARARLAGYGTVSLHCASMVDFRPSSPPDAVFIPFSTFLCLRERKLQWHTLKNIHSYLDLGGACVIDTFEPDISTVLSRSAWRNCFERVHDEFGCIRKEERIVSDPLAREFVVHSRYQINTTVIEDALPLSYLSGLELRAMMEGLFTIVGVWRGYDMRRSGPKCIVMGVKE